MKRLTSIDSDGQMLTVLSTEDKRGSCVYKYGAVHFDSALFYQQKVTESVENIVTNNPDQIFP